MFRLDTIQVSIYISKYSIIRSYDGYVKCAGGSTCKSTYYLVDLYSACAVLCKIIYGPECCRGRRFDPLASQAPRWYQVETQSPQQLAVVGIELQNY